MELKIQQYLLVTIFVGGFGKADLYTKSSLTLIEIVIFPSLSFKAEVILNCKGLMYFKAVQQ